MRTKTRARLARAATFMSCAASCALGCERPPEPPRQHGAGDTPPASAAATPALEGATYEPTIGGTRDQGWDASIAAGAASGLLRRGGQAPPAPRDVEALRWSGGELELSFHDGAIARVAATAGAEAKVAGQGDTPSWPLAISPDGALRVLASEDGGARLVHRSGEDLLAFPASVGVEGAAFSPDGGALFISDAKGKLRVWKDTGTLTEAVGGEVKLQDYVARLNGDFRATFGPMRGALWSGEGPSVVYSEPEGQLVHWDTRAPNEASYVLKVAGPPRSAAFAGDTLLVTSSSGELRASSVSRSNMLSWSREAKADLVATGADARTFAAIEGETLWVAQVETGERAWSLELGEGEPCGLAVDTEGGRVAACVGEKVTVVSLTKGDALAHAERDGERVVVTRP